MILLPAVTPARPGESAAAAVAAVAADAAGKGSAADSAATASPSSSADDLVGRKHKSRKAVIAATRVKSSARGGAARAAFAPIACRTSRPGLSAQCSVTAATAVTAVVAVNQWAARVAGPEISGPALPAAATASPVPAAADPTGAAGTPGTARAGAWPSGLQRVAGQCDARRAGTNKEAATLSRAAGAALRTVATFPPAPPAPAAPPSPPRPPAPPERDEF